MNRVQDNQVVKKPEMPETNEWQYGFVRKCSPQEQRFEMLQYTQISHDCSIRPRHSQVAKNQIMEWNEEDNPDDEG